MRLILFTATREKKMGPTADELQNIHLSFVNSSVIKEFLSFNIATYC